MNRIKKVYQSKVFYCTHLGDMAEDEDAVSSFTIKYPNDASGLLNYLQRGAYANEIAGTMRTYLVRDKKTDACAGFFSLKAGLVSFQETKTAEDITEFDTLPGVEVAFFLQSSIMSAYDINYCASSFEELYKNLRKWTWNQAVNPKPD